jgi:tetratricopeptide (TPR) repeat protein
MSIDSARIKQVLQSTSVDEVRSMAQQIHDLTEPNSPQESQLLQLQIMLWNRVMRLDASKELECCQTIGALWTRMNEPEKALGQLQKALSLNVNDPRTHSLIGDAMFAGSIYPESIKAQERAIALYKQQTDVSERQRQLNLATAHSKLGSVLESKGDFEKAIATLTQAKELLSCENNETASDTHDMASIQAELHAKLGAMHDHLGQYAQAVQELEQAIAIYSNIKGADDPQVQELAFIMEMAANNAKDS